MGLIQRNGVTEVWTRIWLSCCWDNDSSFCQRNEGKSLTANVLTSPSFSLQIRSSFTPPVPATAPRHYTSYQAGCFCDGRHTMCCVPLAVRCRIAGEVGLTFGGHPAQASAQSKANFTHSYARALADINVSSVN